MKGDSVPGAKGVDRLVEALRALPGVGPKAAQRMAYHLLQHDRAGAAELGESNITWICPLMMSVMACTLPL